jgi:hypothetical protein
VSHDELTLPGLQRWMQAVIVHPGDVQDAISSEEARAELPPERLGVVVLPSATLSPAERVGIYHGMYLLRMEEALAADYPLVRRFLGDGFDRLVTEYVDRHPSRSYTLNRLGDHLPRFFAERLDQPDAAFLHDLARFELAMTEVFDEQESPTLSTADLEAVPPESWEAARLRPIAALRLLELEHAVLPHLNAYHRDLPAPAPRRRSSRVAVYRRRYSVLRLELDRPRLALLGALTDGVPLGEALSTAVSASPSPRRQAKVFSWFRTWIREGLFSAIEVEPGKRS